MKCADSIKAPRLASSQPHPSFSRRFSSVSPLPSAKGHLHGPATPVTRHLLAFLLASFPSVTLWGVQLQCVFCVWALKTRDNDRTAPDKEAEKGVMIVHIIPENSRRLRYTCSHLFLLQGWFKIWSITCCAKD